VIENGYERVIRLAKFGTPMKSQERIFPLINLQSEKVYSHDAFKERRCIIPAIGFYEWLTVAPKDTKPTFCRLVSPPKKFVSVHRIAKKTAGRGYPLGVEGDFSLSS
jgi:putative SOS response-associated peptidase YedK